MMKTMMAPIKDNGDSYSFITEKGEEVVFTSKEYSKFLVPIIKRDMQITHHIDFKYWIQVVNNIPTNVCLTACNKEEESCITNQYAFPSVDKRTSTLKKLSTVIGYGVGLLLLVFQLACFNYLHSLDEIPNELFYKLSMFVPGLIGVIIFSTTLNDDSE